MKHKAQMAAMVSNAHGSDSSQWQLAHTIGAEIAADSPTRNRDRGR